MALFSIQAVPESELPAPRAGEPLLITRPVWGNRAKIELIGKELV
jgi:hypothetical protein